MKDMKYKLTITV